MNNVEDRTILTSGVHEDNISSERDFFWVVQVFEQRGGEVAFPRGRDRAG